MGRKFYPVLSECEEGLVKSNLEISVQTDDSLLAAEDQDEP